MRHVRDDRQSVRDGDPWPAAPTLIRASLVAGSPVAKRRRCGAARRIGGARRTAGIVGGIVGGIGGGAGGPPMPALIVPV